MAFCILNKNYKGITNNRQLFLKLIDSDINSEYYAFRDDISTQEFLKNYFINSSSLKNNREYALATLDNRSTIIYMTYMYITRISGYAFGFLVKNGDKYDFHQHTLPLEKDIIKAFQSAFIALLPLIKVKKNIIFLSDNEKFMKELALSTSYSKPLAYHETIFTEDFKDILKTHLTVFNLITPAHITDVKVLKVLAKKAQLHYLQKIIQEPKIEKQIEVLDNFLNTFNKIPIIINNPRLALINTYCQYHIRVKEDIKIQKDEFEARETKLDNLIEVSKELSVEVDKIHEDNDISSKDIINEEEEDLLAIYSKSIKEDASNII